VPTLAASAMSDASRICHSTGSNNAINERTGLPPHICRGARDLQLQMMYAYRFISSPTDEAWNEARVKIGMSPILAQDPKKET